MENKKYSLWLTLILVCQQTSNVQFNSLCSTKPVWHCRFLNVCVYRVFVDVVNGEPVPRKSILKSRSRENSVCSDTSESSTADFEERRAFVNRSHSHDEATYSDTSDGIIEEDSPTGISLYPNGRFEVQETSVAEFAVKMNHKCDPIWQNKSY